MRLKAFHWFSVKNPSSFNAWTDSWRNTPTGSVMSKAILIRLWAYSPSFPPRVLMSFKPTPFSPNLANMASSCLPSSGAACSNSLVTLTLMPVVTLSLSSWSAKRAKLRLRLSPVNCSNSLVVRLAAMVFSAVLRSGKVPIDWLFLKIVKPLRVLGTMLPALIERGLTSGSNSDLVLFKSPISFWVFVSKAAWSADAFW